MKNKMSSGLCTGAAAGHLESRFSDLDTWEENSGASWLPGTGAQTAQQSWHREQVTRKVPAICGIFVITSAALHLCNFRFQFCFCV